MWEVFCTTTSGANYERPTDEWARNLGSGGMSEEVFRCRRIGNPTKTELACKVVDLNMSWGEEAFEQEVRTLKMVQGEPNLVHFVDMHRAKRQGKRKGYLFTRLSAAGRRWFPKLTWEQRSVLLLKTVLQLHQHGVCHLDISLTNLMAVRQPPAWTRSLVGIDLGAAQFAPGDEVVPTAITVAFAAPAVVGSFLQGIPGVGCADVPVDGVEADTWSAIVVLASMAMYPELLFKPGPPAHLFKQLKLIRKQQNEWIEWIWQARSGPAPLGAGSFYDGQGAPTEQGLFISKALDPGEAWRPGSLLLAAEWLHPALLDYVVTEAALMEQEEQASWEQVPSPRLQGWRWQPGSAKRLVQPQGSLGSLHWCKDPAGNLHHMREYSLNNQPSFHAFQALQMCLYTLHGSLPGSQLVHCWADDWTSGYVVHRHETQVTARRPPMGHTLAEIVERSLHMPLADKQRQVKQLLVSLLTEVAWCHSKGVVNLGISPSTIFPAPGKDWCMGTPLLTNLVWAEKPAEGGRIHPRGCDPTCSSPELVHERLHQLKKRPSIGRGIHGAPADLFAAGCCAVYRAIGRSPFTPGVQLHPDCSAKAQESMLLTGAQNMLVDWEVCLTAAERGAAHRHPLVRQLEAAFPGCREATACLLNMLHFDPAKRMSAAQALNNPWLATERAEYEHFMAQRMAAHADGGDAGPQGCSCRGAATTPAASSAPLGSLADPGDIEAAQVGQPVARLATGAAAASALLQQPLGEQLGASNSDPAAVPTQLTSGDRPEAHTDGARDTTTRQAGLLGDESMHQLQAQIQGLKKELQAAQHEAAQMSGIRQELDDTKELLTAANTEAAKLQRACVTADRRADDAADQQWRLQRQLFEAQVQQGRLQGSVKEAAQHKKKAAEAASALRIAEFERDNREQALDAANKQVLNAANTLEGAVTEQEALKQALQEEREAREAATKQADRLQRELLAAQQQLSVTQAQIRSLQNAVNYAAQQHVEAAVDDHESAAQDLQQCLSAAETETGLLEAEPRAMHEQAELLQDAAESAAQVGIITAAEPQRHVTQTLAEPRDTQVAEPEAVSSTAADCAAPSKQLHQTQQHLSTALGQVTEAAAKHSRLQTMLHEDLQQEQQEVQIGNQQLHAMAVKRGLLPEQLGNVQKELQQVEAAANDFTIAAIHDRLRAPLSHAQQEAGPTTQHATPAAVEQAQQQLVRLDAESAELLLEHATADSRAAQKDLTTAAAELETAEEQLRQAKERLEAVQQEGAAPQMHSMTTNSSSGADAARAGPHWLTSTNTESRASPVQAVAAGAHRAPATAATTVAALEGPTSTLTQQHPSSATQQATGVPHDGQRVDDLTAHATTSREHARQQVQNAPEAATSGDWDGTQQSSTQQVAGPQHTGQGSARPDAQHAAPSGAQQQSPDAHLAPLPPGGSRGLSGGTEAAAGGGTVDTRCSRATSNKIMAPPVGPLGSPAPHKPRGRWSRMTSCFGGLGRFKMAAAVSAERADGLSEATKREREGRTCLKKLLQFGC